MIVLGIDPGNARAGWGVIETMGQNPHVLSYGCIETLSSLPAPKRLLVIYDQFGKILEQYHPEAVAVEDLYFATNAKTIIPVGQARGIALLVAAQRNIPVVSYTPLTVKQTVSGSGTADKRQMQSMVKLLLHLSRIPKPDDAADALAVALTHAYSYRLKQKLL